MFRLKMGPVTLQDEALDMGNVDRMEAAEPGNLIPLPARRFVAPWWCVPAGSRRLRPGERATLPAVPATKG